jgi:hypothetical protein
LIIVISVLQPGGLMALFARARTAGSAR